MMNEEKIDMLLKNALSPVAPDERMNQRLKQELEGKKMKKWNAKKMIIGVAACCLLLGTVSIASSGIISSIVSSSLAIGEKDFAKLEELETEAGFSVKAIEQFQNGYQFSDMTVTNNTGYDENGNEMTHYKGIDFTYEKNGEDALYMSVERETNKQSDIVLEPEETRMIEDIEVEYYLVTYKWVPSNYELTEEDKRNLEKDNYFISDGSSKVSENLVSGVSWVQDGIYYHIGNVYGKTEPEVLFQMAEELIMSK